MFGLFWIFQTVPFQCSIRVLDAVSPHLPTAHALVAEVAVTAFSSLS
jgi:hypothetical protein